MMQSAYCSSSLSACNDHYVAFLSNGVNSQTDHRHLYIKRRSPKLSQLVKFAAIVIGLSVIAATFFLARSPTTAFMAGPPEVRRNVKSFFYQDDYLQAFEDFIVKHGKAYATLEEKKLRRKIFVRNLLFIELHNKQNFTYTLAANEFADLTTEEFKATYFSGYRRRRGLGESQNLIDWSLLDKALLPSEIDWKYKGCVSKVRDQRKCGACWAFSAAGAVEGAYCAKHHKLIALSEQQMVDCAGPQGNDGCNGGEMDDAFQYIIDRGGLCTEDSYPYVGTDGTCRDSECSKVTSVVQFADVPRKSESALISAVALKGPVSVAIQADQMPFQFYSNGVFDAPCGTNLNHGVLVIGYGSDRENQQDYWLVKNSWGSQWGEDGFMKLLRNDGSRSGKCGVLLDASYPVVE